MIFSGQVVFIPVIIKALDRLGAELFTNGHTYCLMIFKAPQSKRPIAMTSLLADVMFIEHRVGNVLPLVEEDSLDSR